MRGGEDPNRAHHLRDRLSPRRRFDDVECTISHLLRFPHPALAGRRYGEALLRGIAERGVRPARDGVLEIGGGGGHLAEAAWRGDAGAFSRVAWTALDLSPTLLRAQRARLREHPSFRAVHADALALPFRSGSFHGLALANEVIADLPVREGRNTGALQLVSELARVLAPGSAAVLIEFGGDFPPAAVELVGGLGKGRHVEWSIDFRCMREGASALGFEVAEEPLHALLGADLDVRCASYTDLWRLRRLARVPVFAAPAEEIRRLHPWLCRLLALELPPLGSPRWPDAGASGGFAQLFRALLLRKPT